MEWYSAVIIILGAYSVGSLVFIVNMVSVIDSLRIENARLKIDLLHK